MTSQVQNPDANRTILWKRVVIFVVVHLLALYSFLFLFRCKWQTLLYTEFLIHLSGMGITAGAHRLWSHKTYKARFPLKVFLIVCNTIAIQASVWEWSRDHRVHHKFSETNADPYNSKRGFFFAHVGWLLCKKHPDVKAKGKSIDMSDLEADPLLMMQKKYYGLLALTIGLITPTVIPVYLWNETIKNSFMVSFVLRYMYVQHSTWLVNSAAHMFGNRPYNSDISPRENTLVSFFAMGEGYHNYHHTFPWDYSTSELPLGFKLNITTWFINTMSFFGLAYDLKKVDKDTVKSRATRNLEKSIKASD